MRISVLLAHPNPRSFNHAIAQAAIEVLRANEHDVVLHDLCAERFDAYLPPEELPSHAALTPEIERHCQEVAQAEGFVIVHPNWWGQPPAILKGWVDRVLRAGVAYRFEEGDDGEGIPIGLLRARAAIVLNTSNTPAERENEVFGDPLEALWKRCIFDLCGVKLVDRRMFRVIVKSSPEERNAWLGEVRELVNRRFPRGEG